VGSTLFISDLHLSEETPAIEAGFFSFLERERGAEALYILGDFFEYWIGDDDDSEQIRRICQALKAVSDSGTKLYLARGNRDFVLGDRFAQQVGATLLEDTTTVDVAGTPTLLLHGDTLCTDDVEYQKLRVLLHDPAWQADMLAKSLEERRAFAQALRKASIEKAENDPNNIIDVSADAVARAFVEHGVNRMIHGHTHRADRHQTPEGERIVLGDWTATTGWCLRAVDNELHLESFTL